MSDDETARCTGDTERSGMVGEMLYSDDEPVEQIQYECENEDGDPCLDEFPIAKNNRREETNNNHGRNGQSDQSIVLSRLLNGGHRLNISRVAQECFRSALGASVRLYRPLVADTDRGIGMSERVTDRKAVGVGFEPHEADKPPQDRLYLWYSTTERPYLTTSFSGTLYCNHLSTRRINRRYTTSNSHTRANSPNPDTDRSREGSQ